MCVYRSNCDGEWVCVCVCEVLSMCLMIILLINLRYVLLASSHLNNYYVTLCPIHRYIKALHL